MKKRIFTGFLAALLAAVLLSGCAPEDRHETAPAVAETTLGKEGAETGMGQSDMGQPDMGRTDMERADAEQTETPLYIIPREEEVGIPENMSLFISRPFLYQGTEWKFEMYAQGETDENGRLLFDDSAGFFMKVISDDGEYELFDDQVQLGVPSADVLIDQENRLHIILTDARTAKYEVTDFLYDGQEKKFLGRKIIGLNGINYLGETGTEGENGLKSDAEAAEADSSEEMELCAFLINLEGDTVVVDPAEYITTDDTERMKELNLTEADMPSGYYIYNPDEATETFRLTPETVYSFIDWNRDFVDSDRFEDMNISTTTRAVFEKYLKTYKDSKPGMPFFFQIKDGAVERVLEKPMA